MKRGKNPAINPKKFTTFTYGNDRQEIFLPDLILRLRGISMRYPSLDREMFYGAGPEIFRRAASLRKNMTEAEKKLWAVLRRKQLKGKRFRRQHPISTFIADFYCHETMLVIEVDGGIHISTDQREKDTGREYEMQKLGLRIIRFSNEEIMNNISGVKACIEGYL